MASPSPLLFLLFFLKIAAAVLPPPLLNRYTIAGNPFPWTTNATTVIDPTLLHAFPPDDGDATPICSLKLNLSSPFQSTNYTPPDPDLCSWTSASLELSASAIGAASPDRVGAVWLGGVELIRTSTPVPTESGVVWKVRKDVTRYSAALSRDAVVYMAFVNAGEENTATIDVNVTFHFYSAVAIRSAVNRKLKFDSHAAKGNRSERLHVLYGEPADEIIPLPSRCQPPQPEADLPCIWYRIRDRNDRLSETVAIPGNTRRAVLEITASGHADDEFWYSNPPDFFPGRERRGNGPIRQLSVTVDGALVGSPVPFPAVYPGGVNPLLWTPVSAMGSFVLPSQDLELTPLLGRLLDGQPHLFRIGVNDALPFWLVGANLHLWLDPNATAVSAATTKHDAPGFAFSSKSKSGSWQWEFETQRAGQLRLSGWVASSVGNITTHVKEEVDVSGKISFDNSGGVGQAKFESEYEREVKVMEGERTVLAKMNQKVKFPTKVSVAVAAGENGTYRSDVKVSREMEEEVKVEYGRAKRTSVVHNEEEGKGWMVVEVDGGVVVSGGATVDHSYTVAGAKGCYGRKVRVIDGAVVGDVVTNVCSSDM